MKLKLVISSFVAGLLVANLSFATTVDFAALPSGTSVTNQYPDFVASLSGGNASGAPQIAYYGAGLSNSPTAGYYPTASYLNIAFNGLANSVSFVFNNEGYNGGNAWIALDSLGGSVIATGALSGYGNAYYDLAAYGNIGALSFYNGFQAGQGNWTQALGSLSYTLAPVPVAPVPEPETYAMLLAGLGLLGFMARRRKSITA